MSRDAASSSNGGAVELASDDAQVHTTGARPRSALIQEQLDDDAPPEPGEVAAPSSTPRPPPVLASQCLRDDVAPLEPWGGALRRVSLGGTVAMLVAAATELSTGALASTALVLVAAAPIAHAGLGASYASRARAALLGGALAVALAAARSPAPIQSLLALACAAACAAALFFRAIYRASRGVRVALAIALVSACALGGLGLLHELHPVARAFAGAGLAIAAVGALGFMGEETTGGCAASGALALIIAAFAAAATALARGASARQAVAILLVGGVGATLSALGALQLAASRFGPSLRARVDARGRLRAAPRG